MIKRLFLILLLLAGIDTYARAADLTLTWQDNSTDEKGFNIERGAVNTGPFSPLTSVGPDITTYIDTNLPPATNFCYRVDGFNDGGVSGYTNIACAVTKAPLTVVKAGTGTGGITSSPMGIVCGAVCSASFDGNSVVNITATPLTGSVFAGWTGDCTGTGTCSLTMNVAKTVTATFNAVAVPAAPSGLTVTTK